MSIIPLQHVEVLNRLGQALSYCAAERASYQDVIERFANILELQSISLWLLGARRPMLGREACSMAGETDPTWMAFDEDLAMWQKQQVQPLVLRQGDLPPERVRRHAMPAEGVISLPILYRESSLCGVLNLYGPASMPLLSTGADDSSLLQLLRGVAGQMGIYVDNKSRDASSLLLQEIHHRVKNNLQIVASLLRMQIRRLGHVSAEQALQDSINRIHSIAVVHERLSRTDIGRVDFADLVRQLADSLAESLSAGVKVRVLIEGETVMLDSSDATSAALVANELIQNAIQHGAGETGGGEVTVQVFSDGEHLRLEVHDQGKGLAPGFDLERDAHLGLTIVSTLVGTELHGDFGLSSEQGRTTAWVCFPVDPNAPDRAAASPGEPV